MIDRLRRFENLHIAFWLVKDFCWIQDWKWAGTFMIAPTVGMALYITAFSLNPQVLTWESVVTGGVYRLEYNTNSLLDTNAWHFGPVRTSSVTGVMSVTNAIPITNALEFIRVRFVTNSL